MYRLLALLMIITFVFSMMPTIYAQERHSVQEQARRDAKKDVGSIFISEYFVEGALMGCLGYAGGVCVGVRVASIVPAYGCVVSTVLLGFVVPGLIINYGYSTPNPPPKRLLGKTPEYVDAYTQSYQSEFQRLQRGHGRTGLFVSNAASVGISLFTLISLVSAF